MVINTWSGPFEAATNAAFKSLVNATCTSSAAINAVEIGGITCEEEQCDGSVGFGGSPDENCETTLDALIINGDTFNSGAVAGIRRVKNAIGVARAVMERTAHSLLSGDLATAFAKEMGFREESLGTEASEERCKTWQEEKCQPNYRVNVTPDPETSCGPYKPLKGKKLSARDGPQHGHDTLSLIAITKSGSMAAGTTTNGATHKVPGRVGDGPIMGSGSYVDSDVGGCGATGDGDYMLRFLPCYQAVENMRRGMDPQEAAEDVVRRMTSKFPEISSGIVVVDKEGRHGGAASGWTFTYSFRGGDMKEPEVVSVPALDMNKREL